ncbi:hypothetical protein ACSBR1_002003 [Camellia fascicularis]
MSVKRVINIDDDDDNDDDEVGKKLKFSDDEQEKKTAKEENVSSSSIPTPTPTQTRADDKMVVDLTGSSEDEDMDVEQEEEEEEKEKEKQVSKEGNVSSSSTPMETDDKKTDLPIKKRHSWIESGDSSERAKPDPEDKTDTISSNEEYSLSDLDEYKWPEGAIMLFEMETNWSNRLLIPTPIAADFFPPLAGGEQKEETLQLTDYQGNEWYMTIINYEDEKAFMVTKGWKQFANNYNLQPYHVIRISTPLPCLHRNHFEIDFDREQDHQGTGTTSGSVEQSVDIGVPPEFRPENFLFQYQLNANDTGYFRLFIPSAIVTNYLPRIMIGPANDRRNILKLTDDRGKDWYMNIYYYCTDACIVLDGWDEYVEERILEPDGVIRFYRPVWPSHANHFLIKYVKKGEEGLNVKKGGEEGPNEANPTQPGGDGAGPSRKGKEFASY